MAQGRQPQAGKRTVTSQLVAPSPERPADATAPVGAGYLSQGHRPAGDGAVPDAPTRPIGTGASGSGAPGAAGDGAAPAPRAPPIGTAAAAGTPAPPSAASWSTRALEPGAPSRTADTLARPAIARQLRRHRPRWSLALCDAVAEEIAARALVSPGTPGDAATLVAALSGLLDSIAATAISPGAVPGPPSPAPSPWRIPGRG
jgi:hypothetical protein